MNSSKILRLASVALCACIACFSSFERAGAAAPADETGSQRPNILWITIEDWSPDLSCYGTKGIHTPHVDQLAADGIRFEHAFTTSPVCSTSRSAMMTGFHQNYIRANQHREYHKQPLPHGIKPIPHLLKDVGYFTALMSYKTDCNFLPEKKEELFEGTDWNQRQPDQPFFARITFGGTHRAWKRDPMRPIDIRDVELPPYYADTPFIRRDWANGLEQMQLVDREVGALLQRLDDEGLAGNTIVFFIGDHGRCHIRGKQFLYDGGIRIPMIMRWPGKVAKGQVSDDLVMSIDICATILDAAGALSPISLHGKNLLGDAVKSRQYVFAARDKMDETHDAMRAIRSKDHKLILNLMPERPWCQFNRYKEASYPVLAEMNVLNLQGKLPPEQAAFFAPRKPEVELFDLKKDPYEVSNVADDPAYATVKQQLLAELQRWRTSVIEDQGVSEEFRAQNVFPDANPLDSVNEWVERHKSEFDFKKHGWPAWYPTRTLEQWQAARAAWEPYVFRTPEDSVKRPRLVYQDKK
ncbi:sulfatase family protein [Aureliella helgolandensis]|uniref:Arylsulfatase n=1 Tax=Aureliella helgolandensis TaxID=2527968 RepID=A0A518GAU2_9BACT|nr:sulfatase [Aureliella helgolandensis]QDV25721.1 Arylsulfatase [Aureliella helgolandensis]